MNPLRSGRPKERSTQDDPPSCFRKSVSYIDTIELVLSKHVSKGDFDKWWWSLWGWSADLDRRYRCRKVDTANGFWKFKVVLHQPTSAELYALSEMEEMGRCSVIRVDVALDLIVHDSCSPDELRRHVEGRLIPSIGAKRTVKGKHDKRVTESVSYFEGTTYYFRGRRDGIEVALYSDRLSKTGFGWQCCHLEYRVRSGKALRAAGIPTIKDVYALDHRKFWEARLDFRRPPTPDDLARTSNGAAGARTVESLGSKRNQLDAHMMFRLATHHDQGMLNTNLLYFELRDWKEKYNQKPQNLFQKVDHSWALPQSRNYMWPRRRRIVVDTLGISS